jgi:hypothetical protein
LALGCTLPLSARSTGEVADCSENREPIIGKRLADFSASWSSRAKSRIHARIEGLSRHASLIGGALIEADLRSRGLRALVGARWTRQSRPQTEVWGDRMGKFDILRSLQCRLIDRPNAFALSRVACARHRCRAYGHKRGQRRDSPPCPLPDTMVEPPSSPSLITAIDERAESLLRHQPQGHPRRGR